MQGKINVDDKEHHFNFDEKTFELTIYDIPGITFSEDGKMSNDRIYYKEVLAAQSFDTKFRYIQFVVKSSHCFNCRDIITDELQKCSKCGCDFNSYKYL